jgi:hypothetical protein
MAVIDGSVEHSARDQQGELAVVYRSGWSRGPSHLTMWSSSPSVIPRSSRRRWTSAAR